MSEGLERVHDRIDDIHKEIRAEIKEIRLSAIRTESHTKHIEELADKIFKAVYGNGRDGISQKLSSLHDKVGFHAVLLLCLLTGLVSLAFYVIQQAVS